MKQQQLRSQRIRSHATLAKLRNPLFQCGTNVHQIPRFRCSRCHRSSQAFTPEAFRLDSSKTSHGNVHSQEQPLLAVQATEQTFTPQSTPAAIAPIHSANSN